MKRISLLVISMSMLLIPAASFALADAPSTDVNDTTRSAPATQTVVNTGTPVTNGNTFPVTNGNTQTPTAVSGGSTSITNPLGNINSFCGLIKAILSAVIAIGIPIAVLFIVYAGFKFVLAQGNPKELGQARQNLMYTLIGIGIFLGAWLLALVIANTINSLGAGSTASGQIISCN